MVNVRLTEDGAIYIIVNFTCNTRTKPSQKHIKVQAARKHYEVAIQKMDLLAFSAENRTDKLEAQTRAHSYFRRHLPLHGG